MRITTYSMKLNEDRINTLVKDKSINYAMSGIRCPGDVACVMKEVFDLGNQVEEYVYILTLDGGNKVKAVMEISHGTMTSAPVSPREVFSRALLIGTASIIVVHNHPSGELTPSQDDTKETERLVCVGDLIGIRIVDHIIIGGDNYYSFLEAGIMPDANDRRAI